MMLLNFHSQPIRTLLLMNIHDVIYDNNKREDSDALFQDNVAGQPDITNKVEKDVKPNQGGCDFES